MDAVVEFIDDSTGNRDSALWHQLDETAQARILGAGKVLSVLVSVSKVKIIAETAQLQRKFKHAEDFGIQGNANKVNIGKYETAIQKHVNNIHLCTRQKK